MVTVNLMYLFHPRFVRGCGQRRVSCVPADPAEGDVQDANSGQGEGEGGARRRIPGGFQCHPHLNSISTLGDDDCSFGVRKGIRTLAAPHLPSLAVVVGLLVLLCILAMLRRTFLPHEFEVFQHPGAQEDVSGHPISPVGLVQQGDGGGCAGLRDSVALFHFLRRVGTLSACAEIVFGRWLSCALFSTNLNLIWGKAGVILQCPYLRASPVMTVAANVIRAAITEILIVHCVFEY